jgi:hypothetical protein
MPENTWQTCADNCAAVGYKYAGVENGYQCRCGNFFQWDSPVDTNPAVNCNARCNSTQTIDNTTTGQPWASRSCGGVNRIAIFQNLNYGKYHSFACHMTNTTENFTVFPTTPTSTPTPTPQVTPSPTPTPSPSNSPTPTPSPANSPTPSSSPSPSPIEPQVCFSFNCVFKCSVLCSAQPCIFPLILSQVSIVALWPNHSLKRWI